MDTTFYRSSCLLPFTLHTNGYRDNQEEVIRPEGLPRCSQFSICTGGRGEFNDDSGKNHTICKGDIFYFMPDTPHSYRNISNDWSVKYILISGEAASSIMQKLGYSRSGVIHTDEDAYNKMLSIWDTIVEHQSDRFDKKNIAKMSVICYKTIVELSSLLSSATDEARERALLRLRPVLSIISTQYGNDLSLDYLSSLIGVSPTYLCRLFKTAFNCSPVTYIKNVRMQNARNLLQGQKHRPINEIAIECGFTDTSYFGKVFKKSFGITPAKFRIDTTYGGY